VRCDRTTFRGKRVAGVRFLPIRAETDKLNARMEKNDTKNAPLVRFRWRSAFPVQPLLRRDPIKIPGSLTRLVPPSRKDARLHRASPYVDFRRATVLNRRRSMRRACDSINGGGGGGRGGARKNA